MRALGIVGYRDFLDYTLFTIFVEKVVNVKTIDAIISGGARGADALAKRYAKENNIKLVEYLPDWDAYGRSAGPRRNTQIVEASDVLVAFLSPRSVGTRDSIKKARARGIPVHICEIE